MIPVVFILNILKILIYISVSIFIYKCAELICFMKIGFHDDNLMIINEFYNKSKTFKKMYDEHKFNIKEGNWLFCTLFNRDRILFDIVDIYDAKEKERIFNKITEELNKSGCDFSVKEK